MRGKRNWNINIMFADDVFFMSMQKYSKFLINLLLDEAELVVTDGDFISVILRYDESQDDAARVIGITDDEEEAYLFVALAKKKKVYYSIYPALARQLYTRVNTGEEIEPPLYQSVAKELAKARKSS